MLRKLQFRRKVCFFYDLKLLVDFWVLDFKNLIFCFAEAYCFWGSGNSYRGTQHITAKGHTCVYWSHQYYFKVTDFEELVGHNYCRNPGGAEDRPWCYVEMNQKMHRELCDIPQCGKLSNPSNYCESMARVP